MNMRKMLPKVGRIKTLAIDPRGAGSLLRTQKLEIKYKNAACENISYSTSGWLTGDLGKSLAVRRWTVTRFDQPRSACPGVCCLSSRNCRTRSSCTSVPYRLMISAVPFAQPLNDGILSPLRERMPMLRNTCSDPKATMGVCSWTRLARNLRWQAALRS
jgi:hypothetical protein